MAGHAGVCHVPNSSPGTADSPKRRARRSVRARLWSVRSGGDEFGFLRLIVRVVAHLGCLIWRGSDWHEAIRLCLRSEGVGCRFGRVVLLAPAGEHLERVGDDLRLPMAQLVLVV